MAAETHQACQDTHWKKAKKAKCPLVGSQPAHRGSRMQLRWDDTRVCVPQALAGSLSPVPLVLSREKSLSGEST